MAFEKVEIDTWKPEKEGDEIVGKLVGRKSDVGANNSMVYTIEVDNKPMGVWGSVVLDTKMIAVQDNDMVKIVYLGKGEAKSGHNAPKLFDVFIDYEARANYVA